MLDTFRKCMILLGPGRWARWVLVVALAVAVSGLEVVGALLVFGLLGRITTAEDGLEVPFVGDLRAVFPDTDETVLMVSVAVAIALFFVLRGVTVVVQSYVQHRVAENAGARLAARLLDGYLSMPYAFHLQRNSAELIRNAYDTVQLFVREALIPAVKLISEVFVIVALLAVLLSTSFWATLLALAVLGPLTWLLLRIVHPRVKRLGRIAQEMAKTSLQTLHESLEGWRDIKVLGRHRFFKERFAADRRRLARTRYLRSTAKTVPRVVLEVGLVLFIVGFLGFSVLVEGGALEALPVLGLFGYAAMRLQPSLNEILLALNSLKFVGPGIDLLYEDVQLFKEESTTAAAAADPPLPLADTLRLTDVSVRYPDTDRDAITGVDLTIRSGEFLGVVGPTGGGKTTLVDVILGLLDPTTGTVEVDGVTLDGNVGRWHQSLGVVHQIGFLSDDTLRRNIALGVPDAEIDDALVEEALDLAQLGPFVDSLPQGLATVIGERGVRVSGGQRQRLAIARALYRRPGVLVFDEGTSALDNNTEAQLMAALEGLRGDRTIIAVAHRLSTVSACDRVVLVDDGRVLDVAPFPDLAARHHELLHVQG